MAVENHVTLGILLLAYDGPDTERHVVRGRDEVLAVFAPIDGAHFSIVASEFSVEHKRCKLAIETGCLPDLNIVAMGNGNELGIGTELNVANGMLKVKVVQDNATDKVDKETSSVYRNGIQDRTSVSAPADQKYPYQASLPSSIVIKNVALGDRAMRTMGLYISKGNVSDLLLQYCERPYRRRDVVTYLTRSKTLTRLPTGLRIELPSGEKTRFPPE